MEKNSQNNVDTNFLSEIDLIFNTYDKKDKFAEASKEYMQLESETGYKCLLCNSTVNRPQNHSERRFFIWLHIHESSHVTQLPNYNSMVKHVQNILKNLSATYPDLKDCNCFELGPVHNVLLCRVCQCAVSINEYQLKKHLQEPGHLKNTNKVVVPSSSKNDKKFKKLIKSLPDELNDDKKYIEMGCVPGFVVCSLCSNSMISTTSTVQSHLNDFWHRTNKENPFQLFDYSRKPPNPVKNSGNYSVSELGMNFFLSLIKSKNVEVKNNGKFIYKLYGIETYYCELCNARIDSNDSSYLLKLFASHFQKDEHMKKARLFFESNRSRFPLIKNIPQEMYADARFFKVSSTGNEKLVPGYGEMSCLICMCNLPLDIMVLLDHVQSKLHAKKKISFKLSKKCTSMSIIDKIFDEMSKKDERIKGMQQHFVNDKNSSVIRCKLCDSTLGSSSDTIVNLEQLFLTHIKEKHTTQTKRVHSSDFDEVKCSEISVAKLEEMLVKMSILDKVTKMCISVSKKQGYFKCKACKVRISADKKSLKDHLNKKKHIEHSQTYKNTIEDDRKS